MTKKLTVDEVIKKFQDANLDENGKPKYIYDKELISKQYKNNKSTISIICSKHGEFNLQAATHMQRVGCKKCKILCYEDFLDKAKEQFGEQFDYTLFSEEEFYENINNLPIKCNNCGNISYMSAQAHLRSNGCKICQLGGRGLTNEERKLRALYVWKGKYDYTDSDFSNVKIKTKIYCKKCKKYFDLDYDHHVNAKQGCTNCFKENRSYDLESFKKKADKIHNGEYDYSNVVYVNARTDVEIIHKKCGKKFNLTPFEHLMGIGCKYCTPKSKLNQEIFDFLTEKNIKFEDEKRFDFLDNGKQHFSLDFYLPNYNIAIECQGKQHFGLGGWTKDKLKRDMMFEDIYRRDNIKKELCENHGIKIFYYSNLHMDYPYFVYEDKEKMLEDILNYNQENK